MDKISNFIDSHKSYFTRNSEFILNNNWHSIPTNKGKIRNIEKELSSIKEKLEALKSDEKLTKNVLSRLSAFIKLSEGDRHKPIVKKFIESTVVIIDSFIKKCDYYIEHNNINNIKDRDIQDSEIELQDEIFNKKIKIQDTLDNLNINSEVDNLQVKFFKDEKASLVMKEPLNVLNIDVKTKVETLPVEWSVINSKQMYINMKSSDIPKWNPKKHFFDQDQVVLQFWIEEYNKIKNGITINGFFVHPWLYFHLNFFKTPIPQEDGSEPTIQPGLRDNEWFFSENLKSCISQEYSGYYSKAMLVYGTRRFAKSVILASLAHWRTLTKFNSFGSIVGGTSSDLNALTSKIKTSMTYIDPAFVLNIIKQNWENGETTFGIKEDASSAIIFSSLLVQNLESGAKGSTQKTAGLAPSVSIYDEIGKYPFLKPYLAGLPSFKTPYGFKCITCLAGTGGESDLSQDAMAVLSNPAAFDLLPMDWDLLENNIDPEFITWKRRNFATFFPGQMAYEEGFIKKKENFSKFLGVESKEFSNMIIEVTDWKKNRDILLKSVEDAKKVKGARGKLLEQQKRVQYPLDPEDCFLSSEENPFSPLEVKVHREKIEEEGDIGKKVVLYEQNGRVVYDLAEDKKIPEFPFGGGFVDAPVEIFIEPPQGDIEEYLFIGSFDDYKQEQSDGDSVGSFTIYRRNNMDGDSLKIAATYNSRPDPHKKFHEQGLLLLKMYNAKAFPENEDMDFKIYTDTKNVTWKYLVKGINLAQDLDLNSNGNREFGWAPTVKNIAFGLGLLKNYVNEELTTFNSEGEIENVVKGLTRIKCIGLLEELQYYKKDGNFYRIVSFMGCLMYDHYLTSQFIIPRPSTSADKENYEKKKKNKKKSHSMFGNSRGNFFGKVQ